MHDRSVDGGDDSPRQSQVPRTPYWAINFVHASHAALATRACSLQPASHLYCYSIERKKLYRAAPLRCTLRTHLQYGTFSIVLQSGYG